MKSGTPITLSVTPFATTEMAERALHSKPYQALKNVSCDWRDGVLVLRGRLPSYYLKQVAQEVVARLEGVEGMDNQIQVVPLSDHARADAGSPRHPPGACV
jgi:osmotically-inducible protein OsmY